MRRWALIGLIAASVGLVGVVAVNLTRDGPPTPAAEYIGGASCAGCHGAQTALWSASHHALAMQPATDETVLGDFGGATFRHRGVESTFFRRDEAYFVRTEGADGELAEYEIAFTFGVDPLQQYLVAFPGGRFQVLGIAWDSRPAVEGGQRWYHLYPDTDDGPGSPVHWTRPSQTWNTACAACHSANVSKGFDVGSGTFATAWSDINVSCEACHGPGSRHVTIAAAGGPARTDGDWGFKVQLGDPGRVWTLAPGAATATPSGPAPSDVEIGTCAPCHSRRATLATDHRPGKDFLDFYAPSLLRTDLYHADGQVLDEVYVYGSFLQSRMYQAGVTCSDCHDPHSLQLRAEGNTQCTRCHLGSAYDTRAHTLHDPSSEGARCVACHMPATIYMGVDARRDHSLRVPRPDLSQAIGVPSACGGCHADRSDEWAAEVVARQAGPEQDARGRYARAIHAGRRGDPAAVSELAALAAEVDEPVILRATALSMLGGYAPSLTASAIRAGLRDPAPLVRIGALQAVDGLPASRVTALAAPLVDDPVGAVRAEAARVLALRRVAPSNSAQAAALERAFDEYVRVQWVNADYSSSWVNLGDISAAQGRAADAEAAYRKALELDIMDLVAHLNLADLQRALGRDDLSEQTLTAALAFAPGPDTPEIAHALGLLKVRQGHAREALGWLERAAAARPDNARFAYVHGVALWSTGETEAGIRTLEEALQQHPYDADLLTALATYNRDLGRTDAAISYARRLLEVTADDDGARALLRQLKDN